MSMFARYKALELALSIWSIFDYGPQSEPFSNIDFMTAIEVGVIVWGDR